MKYACLFLVALFCIAGSCFSAPMIVNYEGVVTENGVPFSGTRSMQFTLFNTNTLAVAWDSGAVPVAVEMGYFSVALGGNGMPPLSEQVFKNGTRLHLLVSVEGTPLLPSKPLASVPYAIETRMPHKVFDAVVAMSPDDGDYTTLEAAITSGAQRIYVRPGFYQLDNSVTVPQNVELATMYNLYTLLTFIDCGYSNYLNCVGPNRISGFSFMNCPADGAIRGIGYVLHIDNCIFYLGNTGINVSYASLPVIKNCIFVELNVGLSLSNTTLATLENNTLNTCSYGLLLKHVSRSEIVGTKVLSCGYGIAADFCDNDIFARILAFGNSFAFAGDALDSCTFSDINASYNTYFALYSASADNYNLSFCNIICNNNDNGLYFSGEGNTFNNITANHNTYDGIRLIGKRASLHNVVAKYNGENGMYIDSSFSTVNGAQVTGNTKAGIRLDCSYSMVNSLHSSSNQYAFLLPSGCNSNIVLQAIINDGYLDLGAGNSIDHMINY